MRPLPSLPAISAARPQGLWAGPLRAVAGLSRASGEEGRAWIGAARPCSRAGGGESGGGGADAQAAVRARRTRGGLREVQCTRRAGSGGRVPRAKRAQDAVSGGVVVHAVLVGVLGGVQRGVWDGAERRGGG